MTIPTDVTATKAEDFKIDLFLPKLDLQFLADQGGTPEGGDGGATPPADPAGAPTPPVGGNEPPANPESGEDKTPPTNTFTQEDVNAVAAREAKKAQEKLLKQLGITDFKNAKEGLEQFRQWQDSQKTEAEKLQESHQTLEQEYKQALAEKESLEAKLIAVSNDVKPESMDDVVTLARTMVSEDVTIEDAIKQVVDKYPHFKKVAVEEEPPAQGGPKFSTGNHGRGNQPTEEQKWLEAFK